MSKAVGTRALVPNTSRRWIPPLSSWYPLFRRKLRQVLVEKGFLDPRPISADPTLYSPVASRLERFVDIYSRGIWNSSQPNIPRSGPGSTLDVTRSFRDFLDCFCTANQIQTVVDIGCGDLNWMPTTRMFDICNYIGIDINPDLIRAHSVAYPQHQFLALDVVSDTLPSGDLAIIRDITFHMSHSELMALFRNIKGKFAYYFITSCVNLENVDTFNQYHYHDVNLFLSPFRFTHYFDRIWEPEFMRYIYLFSDDHILIRSMKPEFA